MNAFWRLKKRMHRFNQCHQRPAIALLNAILLLTLVTSALLMIAHSYQQQQKSYVNLTNYYQTRTLVSLTEKAAAKQPINGLKANIGSSRIDRVHQTIEVTLKNGYHKQLPLTTITDVK